MGSSADAYMIWSRNKKDLEELCGKKEQYRSIFENEIPSSPQFSCAQADVIRYTKAQSAVKTALQTSCTSIQTILCDAAEDALTSLCGVVQRRYDHFGRQGAAIGAAIREYTTIHDQRDQDALFCKTLALCSDYASIASINETLLKGAIFKNQFYIDLVELSFVTDNQVRKDFLRKEAMAGTDAALEKLQHEVNTLIEQEQTIRKKLLHKYNQKSLSVEERLFLHRPSPFYRLFAVNLQTACGDSKSYLNRRNDLQHESLTLDERTRDLQSRELVLAQEYITTLLPPPSLPSSPLDNLIFLSPLARNYAKRRDDLEKVIEQKKIGVIQKLEQEMNVMETYLTGILEKGEDGLITRKIEYLGDCIDLAKKVDAKCWDRMQSMYNTLTRVKAYGNLSGKKQENDAPPMVEKSLSRNPIVVESRVVNVKDIKCQKDTFENVVPDVSPIVSIDHSKGNSYSTAKLESSTFCEENILFAFQSINKAADPDLRALCCHIAGYDGQNLSLNTAAERREMKVPAIEVEHLNERDREIFNSLIARLEER